MTQTRLGSFIESNANTFIGFLGSLAIWQWLVAPLWGFDTHFGDNFAITCIFTVWSIIRGYFVRRYFNWRLHHESSRVRKGLR